MRVSSKREFAKVVELRRSEAHDDGTRAIRRVKLRLPVTRMRALGMAVAEATGWRLFPEFERKVTLNCVYRLAPAYRKAALKFTLTDDGLYKLACDVVLSRYIGVIRAFWAAWTAVRYCCGCDGDESQSSGARLCEARGSTVWLREKERGDRDEARRAISFLASRGGPVMCASRSP
jgi:hypothetical protein